VHNHRGCYAIPQVHDMDFQEVTTIGLNALSDFRCFVVLTENDASTGEQQNFEKLTLALCHKKEMEISLRLKSNILHCR